MTARSPTTDGSTDKEATRTRRSRTNPDEESDDNAQHYFLSKTNGADGTPVLNREVANEGEELVEALRLGVTFYAVQEFHAIPDFSGQRSQLNKEVVKGR